MSPALPPSSEALLALSAALASRRPGLLAGAVAHAAAHADPGEVEEALVQSYLFLGYPAALNGLALWREVSGRAPPAASPDAPSCDERGAVVCRTVYGGQYEALRENVRRLHPDMERWMVQEGYGKVLGRPGLALPVRELCIVALLAVLDAPRQLYSHLRGALNAGATPEQVTRALAVASAVSDDEARARAADTWAAVQARGAKED